jgi:hypothetical protein
MVSISTRLALKRRALKVADWLDRSSNDLFEKLDEESSDYLTLNWGSSSDDKEPANLTRRDVRLMIIYMRVYARELRHFGEHSTA